MGPPVRTSQIKHVSLLDFLPHYLAELFVSRPLLCPRKTNILHTQPLIPIRAQHLFRHPLPISHIQLWLSASGSNGICGGRNRSAEDAEGELGSYGCCCLCKHGV